MALCKKLYMTESEKPKTRRPGIGQKPAGPRRAGSRRRFDGRPQRSRRPIAVESAMQRHEAYHPTPKDGLRVFALGGLEEVGRNMSVLEYGDNILIIDMGLQFPEEDMPGIDYIIPNISYLRGKEKNIVGVVITHAHYDHIGSIPHLIPRLGNPPIFGADLTLALIKKRQEEYKDISSKLELHQIDKDSTLNLGVFHLEFFSVSHNIPGAVGVIIHTPEGIVIHTGDFKLDERSTIAGVTELNKLEAVGKQQPLLLISYNT